MFRRQFVKCGFCGLAKVGDVYYFPVPELYDAPEENEQDIVIALICDDCADQQQNLLDLAIEPGGDSACHVYHISTEQPERKGAKSE